MVDEADKRKPRKKGQHTGSSSHSDLYTDENPEGTIKGLKFATIKDAEASVGKISKSGKKSCAQNTGCRGNGAKGEGCWQKDSSWCVPKLH